MDIFFEYIPKAAGGESINKIIHFNPSPEAIWANPVSLHIAYLQDAIIGIISSTDFCDKETQFFAIEEFIIFLISDSSLIPAAKKNLQECFLLSSSRSFI